MSGDVAVIGGGLQGCLTALELAAAGVRVTVFERDVVLMAGASRWNEGKVHLGYIYANDRSLRTARLMVAGAFSFADILARHVAIHEVLAGCSDPFRYAVLDDSLVAPGTLTQRYAAIDELIDQRQAAGGTYLGQTVAPVTADDVSAGGFTDRVQAVFRTGERSVDVHRIADLVADAVHGATRIEVITGAAVDRVLPRQDGRHDLELEDELVGPFQHVVNAAWAGRLALDETLGIVPGRPHLFRFKYGLHLRGLPGQPFPSTSFVLGPYGDVVRFGDGAAYLSWYPVGCTARTTERTLFDGWGRTRDLDALAGAIVAGLATVHGAIKAAVETATDAVVEGGVIFSWGETDVDDPASELHRRFDVGVTTHGGTYHSVDTGKYTLAPLFAAEVSNRILHGRVGAASAPGLTSQP